MTEKPVILITGRDSGLGRAIAEKLLGHGVVVVTTEDMTPGDMSPERPQLPVYDTRTWTAPRPKSKDARRAEDQKHWKAAGRNRRK